MIIRYALFEGEIHPGQESEFRRFVRDRLVPLWTQFPGAEEVRVLDGTARDVKVASITRSLVTRDAMHAYPRRIPDHDVEAAARRDVGKVNVEREGKGGA